MNILRFVVVFMMFFEVSVCAQEVGYPSSQKRFIGDVLTARGEFINAKNQVVQGHIRVYRQESLKAYANQKIENWIGSIYQMSTLSDGTKAYIRVQIDPHIMISTANNEWDRSISNTLIPYKSDLYRDLLSLKDNEWILFSGRFIPANPDGIREISLTMHGSMTDPEFLFKFSDIKKINKNDIKLDSIFGNKF